MAFATPTPPQRPQAEDTTQAAPDANRPATTGPARRNVPRQAHQQYQKALVETASPTRLIVLLYDGAIRFCSLGREAMLARDLEAQSTNLIKAQRILGELMSSLDSKVGGEVAQNLFQLYRYMLEQLVQANLYDQTEPVDEVLAMLRELRDTWQEVDRQIAQAPSAPPAAGEAANNPIVPNPAARRAQAALARQPQGTAPPQESALPPGMRLGDRNA
ncbi:MAG TPA: flagellar export chaperone FliS [Chthonomonadaceae bacterium]|nr:flagellar export chaperone FliS [Chthonomonadaceae bacterium]